MNDLDSLLDNISSYIKSKNYNKKEWQPGTSIQYSGPFFDEEEYLAGIKSLLEGWLVLGDSGMKFERKFPRLFGKKYGVLVNSGSSANLLMMAYLTSKRSYNLQKGTKVLTPVAGFPTTVNPILNFGFEPIFVDIEIDTLNLNLDHVENTLAKNKDIRAITFAHVLGNPPNMNRLMELVKKYNLILLEDCCDALGSTYDGKPLGSFGEMASCSFYPAHHMTMGEGGFIACNTYEQETILRSFREWGRGCYCTGPKANTLKCGTCKKRFSNWIPALPNEIFDHKYIYDEIGYNLKPIELQAAIGLVQLKKLDTIHSLRRRNYKLLFNIYSKYEEFFHLPKSQELSDPSWFAFPLTLKKNAPFTRADIINFLEDNLIQTRPYFAGNILLQPAYSDIMNLTDIKNNFPVAVKVTTDTFFHGTSPVITPEQIDFIGEKVMQFMSKY
jgi:CDP-6-deoxy-D-xylo-4-hexulose-3-dehydrase